MCGFDAADVYANRQDAMLRVSCPNCGAVLVLASDIEEARHE
jgi:ribosomal protein S27AE